jgi:hypothetical protein
VVLSAVLDSVAGTSSTRVVARWRRHTAVVVREPQIVSGMT